MPETNENAVLNTVNGEKKNLRINYGTTKVLKMVFIVNGGKTMTWNLKYPKNDLTKVEVAGVMNEMIEDNAILYNNSEATEIKEAYIYETSYIDIPNS